MTTRDYIYLVIISILLGAGIFGGVNYTRENRKHKRHIKELEVINARNAASIDSLKANVAEYEKQDSILLSQIKTLYITTTDVKPDSIHAMQPDSFLLFITDYINRAGAITH